MSASYWQHRQDVSFARAQRAYDNMTPEDVYGYDEDEDEEESEEEEEEDCDDSPEDLEEE